MTFVARVLAALAVLALATPAFACGGAKKTTHTAEAKTTEKDAVAKSEKKSEAKTAKAEKPQKPATVQN
jgi:hypothetical protein